MKHIYMCRLRKENIKEKYEMIFGTNEKFNLKIIMKTEKTRKQL